MKPDLSIDIAGVHLDNPVMVAAGTGSKISHESLDSSSSASRPGAIVTTGITLERRDGNPVPRVLETTGGMLNSIGLQNPGVDEFKVEELPGLLAFGLPVFVNVSGATPEEYAEVARRLDDTGIAGYEANVSCPNREGMIIGTDANQTFTTVAGIKAVTRKPVIVKLTPNVTDVRVPARAAKNAGADAISLVNTFLGMRFDIETGKPILGNKFGGYSGPPILPQALFKVWQVCQDTDLPVIGMGGISCWQDAIEFIVAGASAVAVGTANLRNPLVIPEIIDGMEALLEEWGYSSFQEWRAKFPAGKK